MICLRNVYFTKAENLERKYRRQLSFYEFEWVLLVFGRLNPFSDIRVQRTVESSFFDKIFVFRENLQRRIFWWSNVQKRFFVNSLIGSIRTKSIFVTSICQIIFMTTCRWTMKYDANEKINGLYKMVYVSRNCHRKSHHQRGSDQNSFSFSSVSFFVFKKKSGLFGPRDGNID